MSNQRTTKQCRQCGKTKPFAAFVQRFKPDGSANGYSPVCRDCRRINPKGEPEARFWSKVAIRGAEDCWLWTGALFSDGYGVFGMKGRARRTHRVAWEFSYGPIPAGMLVCHHCDTPACCNPLHLFLGTPRDNVLDMVAKDRACRTVGEERWSSKLTEDAVRDIRARYAAGGMTQQQLADEYGVTFQNISWIVRRKSWKHVA